VTTSVRKEALTPFQSPDPSVNSVQENTWYR